MDKRTALTCSLALVLAALPFANATWSVKGAFEPDTSLDLTGWMHTMPDTSASGRTLYFNGLGSTGTGVLTTLNPNTATLATRVRGTPFLPVAMLGVWKDCNDDGYVGLGDQGLLEYRAALLLDDSICPAVTPEPGREAEYHNDGTWVVELIPLGYDDTTTPDDDNPLTINDTSARVWADWGRPGEAPPITCAVYPTPRGTFHSTGGLLRWLDCLSGFRVVPAASGAFEDAGFEELSFNDAPLDRPDRSGSPLNAPNPWGTESDPPLATVFDCSSASEVAPQDPTGGELRTLATVPMPDGSTMEIHGTDSQGRIFNVTVPGVSPSTGTGSPAGSVNATEVALTDCDDTDEDAILVIDGESAGSDGNLPYLLEGDVEPVTPFALRSRTDHVFTFEEGARSGAASLLLGARTRDDAGLGTASLTGFWVGTGAALGGPNPFVSRHDAVLESVSYITYYAYASPWITRSMGLRLAANGAGEYGQESCSQPAPVFECDEDLWWLDTHGNDITPRDSRLGEMPGDPTTPSDSDETKIGVRVGQEFQMRDVDCVDTSAAPLRAAGLQWGLLTSTSCA